MTPRILVAGEGEGRPLALAEPLSFWGGFDAATGCVIDRHHPDHGRRLEGCVLFLARGRGSSSGSSVLAEAIRRGTAPAAIVLGAADGIVVTGALVAAMLYGRHCPVVLLPEAGWAAFLGAPLLAVSADAAGVRMVPREPAGLPRDQSTAPVSR
ncbi:MAG: DUF126 domain-containing protein [Azospirillaceae bacterium]